MSVICGIYFLYLFNLVNPVELNDLFVKGDLTQMDNISNRITTYKIFINTLIYITIYAWAIKQ